MRPGISALRAYSRPITLIVARAPISSWTAFYTRPHPTFTEQPNHAVVPNQANGSGHTDGPNGRKLGSAGIFLDCAMEHKRPREAMNWPHPGPLHGLIYACASCERLRGNRELIKPRTMSYVRRSVLMTDGSAPSFPLLRRQPCLLRSYHIV